MGFCLAIDPSWSRPTGGTALQCCGEALLNELLAPSPNGGWAYFQRLTDVLISPAWPAWAHIGFQQNACVQEFARCRFPYRNHLVELGSLVCGQCDHVFLIHVSLLELFCNPRIQHGLPTCHMVMVRPLVAHCFVTNSPQELINLVHLALAQGAVLHGCDILLNLLHRLETRNGNDRAAPRPQPAKRALPERAPITRQDRTP